MMTVSAHTIPASPALDPPRPLHQTREEALLTQLYQLYSPRIAKIAAARLLALVEEATRTRVDVDRFSEGCRRRGRAHLGISDNAVVITCPSRFKARKGQLELLRAMSAPGSLTSHVVLVLARSINSADKNYLEQIRRAATRIGLGERLHILEDVPRARMPDLLAASDIVAQPLLENPALRSRLAGEARRHVREHFSISAMAERMAVLYQHAQAHDRARTDRVGVGA